MELSGFISTLKVAGFATIWIGGATTIVTLLIMDYKKNKNPKESMEKCSDKTNHKPAGHSNSPFKNHHGSYYYSQTFYGHPSAYNHDGNRFMYNDYSYSNRLDSFSKNEPW